MHMKMGIMFNWFTTTLSCWKLLKKAPKRVNKAKKELAYQLFVTPYVLVWRQNVPQSVKDWATGLITGIFSIYNSIICVYLMFLLIYIYIYINKNSKAGIKLNLSEDGQYLKVTDVCDVHNHEFSKVYKFKHYKLNQSY